MVPWGWGNKGDLRLSSLSNEEERRSSSESEEDRNEGGLRDRRDIEEEKRSFGEEILTA